MGSPFEGSPRAGVAEYVKGDVSIKIDKSANRQIDKSANRQIDKSANYLINTIVFPSEIFSENTYPSALKPLRSSAERISFSAK